MNLGLSQGVTEVDQTASRVFSSQSSPGEGENLFWKFQNHIPINLLKQLLSFRVPNGISL